MTKNGLKRHVAKQIRYWFFDKKKSGGLGTFHVSQGDAHNARKQWPQAIEHYKKALAILPNLAPVWIQLGHGFRETNQFEQAEQSYLRALDIEPGNADAKFFLDVTHAELRKRETSTEQGGPLLSVPGEAAWEAAEPPEFRFHPRDVLSSWTRPDDCAEQDGMSVLRLSGQAVGLLPREATPQAEGIVRTMRAFHAISRPGVADDVVSMDAEGYSSSTTTSSGSLWQPKPGEPLTFYTCEGIGLGDLWFVNSRTLRLRFKPDNGFHDPSVILRCFQYDPDDLQRLQLLSEQPISTDIPTFADVTTANPYFPLGFAVCTADAQIISFALLPFPSLCRGGLHFGELLNSGGSKPYLEALEDVGGSLLQAALKREGRARTGRIEVDLDAATGTERIFEKSLRLWLSEVLGLSIGIGHVPQDMDGEVLAYLAAAVTCGPAASAVQVDHNVLLRLPADSVPSLHSLVVDWIGGSGRHAAPFVLASVVDGVPKYILSPSSTTAGVDRQPQGIRTFPVFEVQAALNGPPDGSGEAEPPIAAIRLCRLVNPDEAQLLAPFPLGIKTTRENSVSERIATPTISVIHHFSGDEKVLAAILEALGLQQSGDTLQVLVAGSECYADRVRLLLQRFFPSRGHFIGCPDEEDEGARLNRAAAQAEAELILVLGDAVLLHDPSTVPALVSLMKAPGVASATCILIGPQIVNKTTKLALVSSGYFPFAAPAGGAAGVTYENGEILLNLPRAVWPAAVNTSRLFMVGKEEWRRIGGFLDQRLALEELGTPFWARSIAEGRSHVVTTAVSASLLPVTESVVSRYRAASQFLPPVADASRLSLTIKRLVS
ncbi:hypothetical protein [Pararhizobium sp. A13]|uniref:hypothetical protein n=1 Tax=Pararhizobium sp. A13 TaxID=3133975 RepID=UPI00311AFCC5